MIYFKAPEKKLFFLFLSCILLFVLVVFVVFSFYNGVQRDVFYNEQYKQLLSIVESKSQRVEDFLGERKSDIIFLTRSDDVRGIFDMELVSETDILALKTEAIAKDVAEDIRDYLKDNPQMTVKDLQASDEFREIAIRPIGESGYTYVGDYEHIRNVLHFYPKFHGWYANESKESLPRMFNLNYEASFGEDTKGFFDWREPDGTIKEKFMYIAIVDDVRTADDIGLSVGATIYVDEYGKGIQLANELDRKLELFQERKGYSDMIFINVLGDVIWTAKKHNELGTNLLYGIYNESLLSGIFNYVMSNSGMRISDFKKYGFGEKLNLFIGAPIFIDKNDSSNKNIGGIVGLRMDSSRISDLIKTDAGLEEYEEIYIVNKYHEDIARLSHSKSGIVNSSMILSCFEGEGSHARKDYGAYENYNGVRVLGASRFLPEFDLCVIAEVNEDDFLESMPLFNKNLIISVLVLLILSGVIAWSLNDFFKFTKGRGK